MIYCAVNDVMAYTEVAMKHFNVTGLCVPSEDYMVDISGKITEIMKMVEERRYFTINRARQYGKTTTLYCLKKALLSDYIVISISFEGMGDESFASSEAFCKVFVKRIVRALRSSSATKEYISKWDRNNISSFDALSEHITEMCEDEKVVLMIDEVDKTANNRVFLNLLSMLREKFLMRKAGEDFTFHSVVLAGVYDIKNIKLKMINDGLYTPSDSKERIYNSPWNIAVDFNIDMSFNPNEIATMLAEYENDHSTGMDIKSIANEIYFYTTGYPYLVSRICQHIDENLNRNWTLAGIRDAISIILAETNTLFDDLMKNLENNKSLYELIYEILIIGEQRKMSIDNPIMNVAIMYGIINNHDIIAHVSNIIFEIRICNYFISKDETKGKINSFRTLQNDIIKNGRFDMDLCIRKFAEHYAEIYNDADIDFLERHGRIMFLTYLKPLINGAGFYHIESQFTDRRRMDVVVDFGSDQYIIELKMWRGEQYMKDAYEQLAAYLDNKHAATGYLLTFDLRKAANKAPRAQWVHYKDKLIFDVVI